MEVSGEAADLVMKEGVQISEEAIKLLARGAKNLAALLYALAKDQKKLYGKVNMNRLLSEQRPIEVLPLRTEDFDEFKRRAKKVGLLFSTILDKKGDEPYLEILTNIDHLSQANYILEQMGYQPRQLEDAQPKKEQTPARPEPSLQKRFSWEQKQKRPQALPLRHTSPVMLLLYICRTLYSRKSMTLPRF